MKKIAIVAGGDSSESEVSLKSAAGIYSFIPDSYEKYIVVINQKEWVVNLPDGSKRRIDKNDFSFCVGQKKIEFDFVYITIHGTPGENGILQGYFDLLNIPFSGCDVLCSALTFDKFACNHYLKGFGIDVEQAILLKKADTNIDLNSIVERLGLPLFVKPIGGGSSLGVTKVEAAEELKPAIEKAFAEDSKVMAEKFMSGIEVTCGMYKTRDKTVIFPVSEIVPQNDFFDYDAKYNGMVEKITPARISDELTTEVKAITEKIYDIVQARGIIRVDYIIRPDNKVFMLEVNTTPGMTPTSFIPRQVAAAGLNISDVMVDIIEEI